MRVPRPTSKIWHSARLRTKKFRGAWCVFSMAAPSQFPDEQSESGAFERQEDAFRNWVSADGSTPWPAVAGRYHLYACLACPWASRTVIVRHLKGLEQAISLSIIDP